MAKLTHNPSNPHGFKTEGSLLLDQVLEHLGIDRAKLVAKPNGKRVNQKAARQVREFFTKIREKIEISQMSSDKLSAGVTPEYADTFRKISGLRTEKKIRLDHLVSYLKGVLELPQSERESVISLHVASSLDLNAIYRVMNVDQKRAPTNIQRDIVAQSEFLYRSFVELVTNGIDASLPKDAAIGRFGLGFFQVLKHLRSSEDSVTVETKSPSSALVTQVKFTTQHDQIFVSVRTSEDPKRESGTRVNVCASHLVTSELQKLLLDTLRYQGQAQILLNETPINPESQFKEIRVEILAQKGLVTVIDKGSGMQPQEVFDKLLVPKMSSKRKADAPDLEREVAIRVVPGKDFVPGVCSVSLCVGGVIIESIPVAGNSVPEELVIHLPGATSLSEKRSSVTVDAMLFDTIQRAAEMATDLPRMERNQALNALLLLADVLDSRCRDSRVANGLTSRLISKLGNRKDLLENAVPADPELVEIEWKKPLTLISRGYLPGKYIIKHPDLDLISDYETEKGRRIYRANLAQYPRVGIAVTADAVFIDRAVSPKVNEWLLARAIELIDPEEGSELCEVERENGLTEACVDIQQFCDKYYSHLGFRSVGELQLAISQMRSVVPEFVEYMLSQQLLMGGLPTNTLFDLWSLARREVFLRDKSQYELAEAFAAVSNDLRAICALESAADLITQDESLLSFTEDAAPHLSPDQRRRIASLTSIPMVGCKKTMKFLGQYHSAVESYGVLVSQEPHEVGKVTLLGKDENLVTSDAISYWVSHTSKFTNTGARDLPARPDSGTDARERVKRLNARFICKPRDQKISPAIKVNKQLLLDLIGREKNLSIEEIDLLELAYTEAIKQSDDSEDRKPLSLPSRESRDLLYFSSKHGGATLPCESTCLLDIHEPHAMWVKLENEGGIYKAYIHSPYVKGIKDYGSITLYKNDKKEAELRVSYRDDSMLLFIGSDLSPDAEGGYDEEAPLLSFRDYSDNTIKIIKRDLSTITLDLGKPDSSNHYTAKTRMTYSPSDRAYYIIRGFVLSGTIMPDYRLSKYSSSGVLLESRDYNGEYGDDELLVPKTTAENIDIRDWSSFCNDNLGGVDNIAELPQVIGGRLRAKQLVHAGMPGYPEIQPLSQIKLRALNDLLEEDCDRNIIAKAIAFGGYFGDSDFSLALRLLADVELVDFKRIPPESVIRLAKLSSSIAPYETLLQILPEGATDEECQRITERFIEFCQERILSVGQMKLDRFLRGERENSVGINEVTSLDYLRFESYRKVPINSFSVESQEFINYMLLDRDSINEQDAGVASGVSREFKLSAFIAWKRSHEDIASGGFVNIDDIPSDLNPEAPTSQTAQAEINHAVNHLGSRNVRMYLRELIQNSIDAYRGQKAEQSNRQFYVDTSLKGTNVNVRISDRCGMSPHTLFNYLLVPGESNKGSNAIGKNGLGFFSVFKEADEVTLTTSADGVTGWRVVMTPIKSGTNVVDVNLRCESIQTSEIGTVVELRQRCRDPYSLISTVSAELVDLGQNIPSRMLEVKYNGESVVKAISKSAVIEIAPHGRFTVSLSTRRLLTHGHLPVRELELEDFIGVPKPLLVLTGGLAPSISLDIPTSFDLVRSRDEVVDKDIHHPQFQRVLARGVVELLMKSNLNQLIKSRLDLKLLPYDYLFERRALSGGPSVAKIVEAVLSGNYSQSEFAMLSEVDQLKVVLNLPLVTWNGEKTSMEALRQKVLSDEVSIEDPELNNIFPESLIFKRPVVQSAVKNEAKESKLVNRFEFSDGSLAGILEVAPPEVADWIRKHQALLCEIEGMSRHLCSELDEIYRGDNRRTKINFYYADDGSNAHADRIAGEIGFNLHAMMKGNYYFDPEAVELEDRLCITNYLEIFSHEYAHTLESLFSVTHNSEHRKLQANVLVAIAGVCKGERIETLLERSLSGA